MKIGTLLLLFLFLISFASAGYTVISGIAVDAEGNAIDGANVTIDCNGSTKESISLSAGDFGSHWTTTECDVGSTYNIYINKGALIGFTSGVLSSDNLMTNDLLAFRGTVVMTDPSSVPEFGFFGMVLTILCSALIFGYFRRD